MPCCGHKAIKFRREVAKRAGQVKADERIEAIIATPDELLSPNSLRLKRNRQRAMAVQQQKRISAQLLQAAKQLDGKIPPAPDKQ